MYGCIYFNYILNIYLVYKKNKLSFYLNCNKKKKTTKLNI